jgi:acetyl-CoA carboxylase carboxyl transferase subunit beta
MNWIQNFVRPKIRSLVTKSNDIPDDVWQKCVACQRILHETKFTENLFVCPTCDHHGRMGAKDRCASILDEGYTFLDMPDVPQDPLKFKDKKKYTDRLKIARQKTNEKDAVLVAEGHISGQPAVVAVFDFTFMGGSMGMAVGEALIIAAEKACQNKSALIIIPASGGARMQEGILSLMQMPRSIYAISRVQKAKLPYFVILTDPTSGGVSASFAMLGDIAIAEQGAEICFTGKRVIRQTIGEKLPEGFQTAEYLKDAGTGRLCGPPPRP